MDEICFLEASKFWGKYIWYIHLLVFSIGFISGIFWSFFIQIKTSGSGKRDKIIKNIIDKGE